MLFKLCKVITLILTYLGEWGIQKSHHSSHYKKWPCQGRPGIRILCPCQGARQGPQKQGVSSKRAPDPKSGEPEPFPNLKTGEASEKISQCGSTGGGFTMLLDKWKELGPSASFPPLLSFPHRHSKWGLLKPCFPTKVVQSNTLADTRRFPAQHFTASSTYASDHFMGEGDLWSFPQ